MNSIKAIAFDIDGTLTQGISWRRIHKVIGISPEDDQRWHDDYYIRRSISFREWIIGRLAPCYAKSKRTRQEIQKAIEETELQPGVVATINTLQKKFELYLISSGVDIFVGYVARILNIEAYHANYIFTFDSENKVTGITYEAPEEKAKVKFLKRICKQKNLKPKQIVFVGDSMNDRESFLFTKRGILVGRGNEALRKASWRQVETLPEIIPLLLP